VKGKRFFVAALGNDTVEVVDLVGGNVTNHIKSLRAPQGIGLISGVTCSISGLDGMRRQWATSIIRMCQRMFRMAAAGAARAIIKAQMASVGW
jgi:hypothetical protein